MSPDDDFDVPDPQPPDQDRTRSRAAAAARARDQHTWVDQQIRVAMERGDFDDLPGAGQPIRDLADTHDPDWWVKRLVEREQITGVLPPSLQLRKDDAELDTRLDALAVEAEVRREVVDFNDRVIRARYSLTPGPPLVTMPRDVDATVAAWAERREARREELRARNAAAGTAAAPRRRRWWHRRNHTVTDR